MEGTAVIGRLLTAREVAELLGVSAETVLRWHRAGKLPAIPLPSGAIRFREDALEAWLEQRAATVRGVVEHPAGHRPRSSVHSISSSTPTNEED
jgi:excisionase family DNA binding protein